MIGDGGPAAPQAIQPLIAGWSASLAWQIAPHLHTWRLVHPDRRVRFLKLAPASASIRLIAEASRMGWARAYLPVPVIVSSGSEGGTDWLLTEGLPGQDATICKHHMPPERLVPALARGLRAFHELAPVADCPFDFRIAAAQAQVRQRVATGRVSVDDLHPEHANLGVPQALERLQALAPDTEDLVVCHGDYCLPNVLLQDGQVIGYLDLGELGVADRCWDVVVGAWSVTWNLGAGWEDLFYDSYGLRPDARAIAFYRLLYDLAS
jgi:kanamycin kinase